MTIDAPTYGLLQNIVRQESRSLLQYIDESYPWTTPQKRELYTQVKKLIDEDRQSTASLVRLLNRRRLAPPYLGSYPMDFTTINFVALAYLLPLLVKEQRRTIARLEADLLQVRDPEARATVQGIVDAKQSHLKVLVALAGNQQEGLKV